MTERQWKATLRKARKIWMRISMILSMEGVYPKALGLFFKAFMKAVLIYGSEKWVITPRVKWVLGSFQQRVARDVSPGGRRVREGEG